MKTSRHIWSSLSTLTFLLYALLTANAEVLEEWTFNDLADTVLTETKNSTGKAEWSVNFQNSITDGKGHFRVRRNVDSPSNAYAKIPKITEASTPVWIVLEIAAWNFRGSSFGETIRAGFTVNKPDRKPSVVAQMRLKRIDENTVILGGDAFGESATSIPEKPLFKKELLEPLTLVLNFDKEQNSYAVFYKMGSGKYKELGHGTIDKQRNGNYLRLNLGGRYNASDEFLAIDRIALTDENPVMQ